MSNVHKALLRATAAVVLAAAIATATALSMTGCNVVRSVTTKSEYYQKGDTSVMIQTKVVESYDATKK